VLSSGESRPGFIFFNVQRLWIDYGMRLQRELRNVSRCFSIQKLFTQKRSVNLPPGAGRKWLDQFCASSIGPTSLLCIISVVVGALALVLPPINPAWS
jgi:hypothetical protein